MATASSMTGRASAGRPSSENPATGLCSEPARLGRWRSGLAVAVRAGGGQFPADRDGFLCDRQGLGRAAQLPERDPEAIERLGELRGGLQLAHGVLFGEAVGSRQRPPSGIYGSHPHPRRFAQPTCTIRAVAVLKNATLTCLISARALTGRQLGTHPA